MPLKSRKGFSPKVERTNSINKSSTPPQSHWGTIEEMISAHNSYLNSSKFDQITRCTCKKSSLCNAVENISNCYLSGKPNSIAPVHLALFLSSILTHGYHINRNSVFRYHKCPIIRRISEAAFNLLTYKSPAPQWLHLDSPLIYFLLKNKATKQFFFPTQNMTRNHIKLRHHQKIFRVTMIPNYNRAEWSPVTTHLVDQVSKQLPMITKTIQKKTVNIILTKAQQIKHLRKLPSDQTQMASFSLLRD